MVLGFAFKTLRPLCPLPCPHEKKQEEKMKLIGRTSTTFKLGKRFNYMHLSFIYADISITKVFFFFL